MSIPELDTAAGAAAALSSLLSAPSRDAVALLFSACYRLRHDVAAAAACTAMGSLPLEPAAAARLAYAMVALVRRALYESSELQSVEAVAAMLPPGLDSRLQALVAGVRASSLSLFLFLYLFHLAPHTIFSSPPPPFPPPQVIFSSLPVWREAAIDSRVSLPRLESTSWSVDAVNSSSALAAANEPVLRLCLKVREQPSRTDELPAVKDLALTVPAASLGALVEGMRKIKDSLAALNTQ